MIEDVRIGADLGPRGEPERADLLAAAGVLDRADCPPGFVGHSALWARDRDLLVGQGAIVELRPDAPSRPNLVPRGMPLSTRIALIDMLAVRPEYTETGLEERLSRALVAAFAGAIPRPAEAVIYMGRARAPVLLSTLLALGPVEEALR